MSKATSANRPKRHTSGTGETTRNHRMFHVIYVWGTHDTYPRCHSTYGRREAIRYATGVADRGAKIVLLKKGTFGADMKLIADFSTVGGA